MTIVIAHRGASRLEAENSLAAFRRAVAVGADGIELDIHATSDLRFVVVHDELFQGRPISTLTLAQVRGRPLENGEVIPTLAEALESIGPATTVFIEVKTLSPHSDPLLLAELAAGPNSRGYHLHSFDHRTVQRLRERAPERTYGVLSCSRPVNPLEQLRAAGATELWQHESLIDADLVRTVHDGGGTVFAWTVDDPVRIGALKDLGVDGVCTNRPDSARAWLT